MRLLVIALATLLAACMPPAVERKLPAPQPDAWRLVPPQSWPRLRDELPKDSLASAAAQSTAYLDGLDPAARWRVGGRSVGAADLAASAREMATLVAESKSDEELSRRLAEEFDLYESIGSDGEGKVVFSAYYQPTLRASRKRTARFRYPLYERPKDLVAVDLAAFGLGGSPIVGRVKSGRLIPYFDRRDIDVKSALAGRHLELAWLDSDFDRLTLHVEGSGVLEFPDGSALARFAATNGLPFASVGSVVVGAGAMSRSEITHESLRQYLLDHPEGSGFILEQDPRYSFFRLEPLEPGGEPSGNLGRPLTPGRSIATDPKIVPMGAVAYLETTMPQADAQGRILGFSATSRFVLSQDTGGAIQGPGRVDIFMGHGPAAEAIPPRQWAQGRLYLLIRKASATARTYYRRRKSG